ncbi:MAG: magnesium transporter CorA family protein [Candidatus Moranbacteria bacterium]|nr:magnesium transporter CorA family protein [Candidatus Moranbacteria bacterium]
MKSVSYKNITWIDFSNPGADDIIYLQEHFNIHPLAIEEFVTPTFRPKATKYHNCLYLTIHIPLFDVVSRTTYPGEIDIVVTKDHLITGHMSEIYQFDDFFSNLEKSEGKRRIYMNKSPAHLIYYILEMLLESCFPRLDHIHEKLVDIEEQVFNGKEKEMVEEISLVKRDVLNFRRTLKPQRHVIESLAQMESELLPADLKPYFQDLVGTNIRLWNALESNKETIESMEETNNSLLSNKLNSTMKILTVFSAIMMPMTVYSNILAMTADIPFGKSPHAFAIHVSIMLVISGLTMILFRIKKWL